MGTESVWRCTAEEAAFPSLDGEFTVDVAIVGGGITGITLAMLLSEAGKSVAVLEARAIGLGSTGNSTGNLYSVLSKGLHPVGERWGEEVMAAVAESRRRAVDLVEHTVSRLGLDCGFVRCPLHRYATTEDAEQIVEREHRAALRAGLPARLAGKAPIAIDSCRTLMVDHQAQIHPLDYVRGIARRIASSRCRVFEQSPVIAIDEERRTAFTTRGTVSARDLVLATHTPKGLYLVQAEMVPHREYGLAMRVNTSPCENGIFWGEGDYPHSVRRLQARTGDYLVLVGESHHTGHHDADAALSRLEDFAHRHFDVATVDFRWSAQNYHPADALPYIGRSHASDVYVATGFATDGLTYGTLAATIIADAILGRYNRWAELYRAKRLAPVKAAKGVLEESTHVAKALVKDYLTSRPTAPLDAVPADGGMVVEVNGDKLAVYRDQWGAVTAVSPVCTHMKCLVHWNDVEKSWDCPCHGSRFDIDGRVIEGPALVPLARRPVD